MQAAQAHPTAQHQDPSLRPSYELSSNYLIQSSVDSPHHFGVSLLGKTHQLRHQQNQIIYQEQLITYALGPEWLYHQGDQLSTISLLWHPSSRWHFKQGQGNINQREVYRGAQWSLKAAHLWFLPWQRAALTLGPTLHFFPAHNLQGSQQNSWRRKNTLEFGLAFGLGIEQIPAIITP